MYTKGYKKKKKINSVNKIKSIYIYIISNNIWISVIFKGSYFFNNTKCIS